MANKIEPQKIPVAILGAGMAGLSAALYIQSQKEQIPYLIYESSNIAGGISSSFTIDGFTFDYGIHGIYSKNEGFLRFLTEEIGGKHKKFRISISDYWKGIWVGHPIYFNLSEISREEAAIFLNDFLQTKVDSSSKNIHDYKEWCLINLGKKISEEFVFPYIRKFWAVEPEELTHKWMGERVKSPSIQEIVNGALLKSPPNSHYVKGVYYPQVPGFGGYATKMASKLKIQYNKKVVSISPQTKTIRFADGESITYEAIISTIPLPELVRITEGAPQEIVRETRNLRATSLMLINIGVSRRKALKYHWVYSLDPEIPFARLSSPSMWSNKNAPKGTSSIQAEIYFLGTEPNREMTFNTVVASLENMGVLKHDDNLIVKDIRVRDYANIIHDHARLSSIKKIHEFLQKKQIAFCGRYSFWDYSLIDEVNLKAQLTAQKVIDTFTKDFNS